MIQGIMNEVSIEFYGKKQTLYTESANAILFVNIVEKEKSNPFYEVGKP